MTGITPRNNSQAYRGSHHGDRWSALRVSSDATLRRYKHGPIRPMEQPGVMTGIVQRIFGGR